MTSNALSERLLQALTTINTTTPRLIAAPAGTAGNHGRGKRASVAISTCEESCVRVSMAQVAEMLFG
jgi:hypothetical protein